MDDFRDEMKVLGSLGKTFVVESSARRESTCVDRDTVEELVSALRNLGVPAKRARERIERTIEKLAAESGAEHVTEDKILTTALRSGSPG